MAHRRDMAPKRAINFFVLRKDFRTNWLTSYAAVAREVKSFQNYFSLRRCPTEIVSPKIIWK